MKEPMPGFAGNDRLKERLASDIGRGSLSHAYILEGKVGSGKRTLSHLIAASLACTHRSDPGYPLPCGECEGCRKTFAVLSPDVIRVSRENGKATLGVDAIRALRATLSTHPSELDRKIYIIEDADTMTVQAQNALLLSLEEPPPFVLFLLLTTQSRALLETIRSRAPILRLDPLPLEALDAYLVKNEPRARLLKQNQPDEYAVILTVSGGAIGEALRLLDPKERKLLLERRALSEEILAVIAEHRGVGDLLRLVSAFPQKRPEAILQLQNLICATRDLVVLKYSEPAGLCFFADRRFDEGAADSASELASRFSTSALLSLAEAAERAVLALEHNASLPLTLTELAISAGL